MENITFIENISIEPCYLNSDIENTIKNRVEVKYKNFCNKRWGYLNMIKSVKIVENMLDRVSCNIYFRVVIDAERYLPKEDTTISAVVQMCFPHGILCKFKDLNILISMNTIPGGKIENGSIKSKDVIISKNDEIKVRLTTVKYEKHKYSAIGVLD
jgi:DNA-directed RNA polymerase subunit E'/Rpb7